MTQGMQNENRCLCKKKNYRPLSRAILLEGKKVFNFFFKNPNVVSVLPYKASELWAATFLKVNHTYTHTVKAAFLPRPWFDY